METPSGKGAGDENFPVGSLLLPKAMRPHVARYYAFARAIDDVSDNPELPPEEKIARLTAFAEAIHGQHREDAALAKAHACRQSLLEHGVPLTAASDLTIAFIQDARKNRYANWQELLGYCENSANPVGRFLVHLHGDAKPETIRASDALCTALQIINHLQDCGKDFREMDRVYLPDDWMQAEGTGVDDLHRNALTPGLRRVLNRCLDGTEALLAEARPLPGLIANRRFAMEAATIYRLAVKLTAALRRRDPLAERVAFGKATMLWTALEASGAVLLRLGEGRRPAVGIARP